MFLYLINYLFFRFVVWLSKVIKKSTPVINFLNRCQAFIKYVILGIVAFIKHIFGQLFVIYDIIFNYENTGSDSLWQHHCRLCKMVLLEWYLILMEHKVTGVLIVILALSVFSKGFYKFWDILGLLLKFRVLL